MPNFVFLVIFIEISLERKMRPSASGSSVLKIRAQFHIGHFQAQGGRA